MGGVIFETVSSRTKYTRRATHRDAMEGKSLEAKIFQRCRECCARQMDGYEGFHSMIVLSEEMEEFWQVNLCKTLAFWYFCNLPCLSRFQKLLCAWDCMRDLGFSYLIMEEPVPSTLVRIGDMISRYSNRKIDYGLVILDNLAFLMNQFKFVGCEELATTLQNWFILDYFCQDSTNRHTRYLDYVAFLKMSDQIT